MSRRMIDRIDRLEVEAPAKPMSAADLAKAVAAYEELLRQPVVLDGAWATMTAREAEACYMESLRGSH